MILPTGRKPSRSGLTLIEVLVAVAVLSTGLVLVLGAFDSSMSGLRSARDTIMAYFLLEEILSAVDVAGVDYRSGVHDEEGEVPHTWSVESVPIATGYGSDYSKISASLGFEEVAGPYELITYGFLGAE